MFASCSGGSSLAPPSAGAPIVAPPAANVPASLTNALASAAAERAVATIGGCGGSMPTLTNGVEYPAGWTPYGCTSSFNARVSTNPQFASYSAASIAGAFANGNTQPVRGQEAGSYDYGHPVYYATSSDPTVTLQCTQYCNRADNGGYPATIHIPAQARPARGQDAHIAVVQPDGTEVDFWGASQPSGNWGTPRYTTISAAAAANCGSFLHGSGWTPTGPAATSAGACLGAGLLRATELLAGSIDHALFMVSACAVGWQFPAFPNATTAQCSSGVGAPLGGRLWYDVADATTNANPNLRPWEKAILNALHDYGGYLGDNIGGGSSQSGLVFLAESGEAAHDFGLSDPFAALAEQGWNALTVAGGLALRQVGADPWRPGGVDFLNHLHWLAPCSAQGTC